jgi:nitrite reductase (NADH) small subunit/3-phenylpropionate/trans-cinnamate dioxygenase ferredoxin subunit
MNQDVSWTAVAQAEELQDGGSKAFSIGSNEIALFKHGEEYFAVANECAHYGAPLCGGYVRNGAVMCPWHGWQFDLRTGECRTAPGCDIEAFEVKVEHGVVSIAVPN